MMNKTFFPYSGIWKIPQKNNALNDLFSVWNICFLYKEKKLIDIFDSNKKFSHFFNGPISEHSFLISEIFHGHLSIEY